VPSPVPSVVIPQPAPSPVVNPLTNIEEKEFELDGVVVTNISLGSSTVGIVVKGRWSGCDVAIKKVDKAQWALVKSEAQLHHKLRHPNIPQMYGVVSDDTGVMIVMEYCENGSLSDAMVGVKAAEVLKRKKKILCDITSGMIRMHAQNICHGDLKPANVVLSSEYVAKVTDFGISKKLEATHSVAKGFSPMYVAPEVLEEEKLYLKSDVYSFSFIMLYLIGGIDPFAKVGSNWMKLLRDKWKPSLDVPGMDNSLKELILQCWSDDPNARPSFEEILPRIQAWEPSS